MWNSENKLLCLYRATGRFGELPPEVRGNIYTEKSFTIEIGIREQREIENQSDQNQIAPDEIKTCDINFTLSWENGHFRDLSSIQTIETAFQQNNIPTEWIRAARFSLETSITVRWWPTLREDLTQDLDDREQEWTNAGNTLESFPRKAKDLFPQIVNTIHGLLATPTLYRRTVRAPPETMTYNSWENPWAPNPHISSNFTSNGSVTFFYIPKNLRLIDNWSNKMGMNKSNQYVGQ